jgi:predicted component of type VI protein secretion system
VRQGAQAGTTYHITSAEAIIGREEETEISVRDPEVSRRHARISWQSGNYSVEDLGSTNGTFLNGALVTSPQPLRSGDTIGMGQTLLVFQTEASAVTAQAPVPPVSAPPPQPSPAAAPAEQKSGNSQCLLWGCGCLILLGLFSIILVGIAIIIFGQEIQPLFDSLGFTF